MTEIQQSRRRFLQLSSGLVAMGCSGGLLANNPSSLAQTIDQKLTAFKGATLTIADWGGAGGKANRQAWYQPFAKAYGITVEQAGPPEVPRIITMVKSGQVNWDLVYGMYGFQGDQLGQGGYLEPIDYQLIDKSALYQGMATQWSVAGGTYASTLVYRHDRLPHKPTSVTDLWDMKKFPGRRILQDYPVDNLIYALQADGVPKDQLYPLTEAKIKQAYKKLDQIKNQVIWWQHGDQPYQWLGQDEGTMAIGWNGRYFIWHKKLPIGLVWQGAQVSSANWCMLKGSPNRQLAALFLAWTLLPKNDARRSQFIGNGPVNRQSMAWIDPKVRGHFALSHGNQLVTMDNNSWDKHYSAQLQRWQQWRLG